MPPIHYCRNLPLSVARGLPRARPRVGSGPNALASGATRHTEAAAHSAHGARQCHHRREGHTSFTCLKAHILLQFSHSIASPK